VSPSIAIPLFAAAQDESRDELRELFARLLAAAMDPKRKDLTRGSFTAIVKQLAHFIHDRRDLWLTSVA